MQNPTPSRIATPAPRRALDGKFQHVYRRAAEEALIYLETRGTRTLQNLQETMAELKAEDGGEAQLLVADHVLSRRAPIEELNRQLAQARVARDHLEFALRRRLEEILATVGEAALEWNAFLESSITLAAISQRRALELDVLGRQAWHAAQKLDTLCREDPAFGHRQQVMREETVALCAHLRRVLGHFSATPEELRRVAAIMRSSLTLIVDRDFLEEVRGRVYIKEGDTDRVRRYTPILEVPGVVCRFRGLWGRVWAWVGEARPLPWLSEDFVAVARHAAVRLDPDALARGELVLNSDFVDSVTGLPESQAIREARAELARARTAVANAEAQAPAVALRILL